MAWRESADPSPWPRWAGIDEHGREPGRQVTVRLDVALDEARHPGDLVASKRDEAGGHRATARPLLEAGDAIGNAQFGRDWRPLRVVPDRQRRDDVAVRVEVVDPDLGIVLPPDERSCQRHDGTPESAVVDRAHHADSAAGLVIPESVDLQLIPGGRGAHRFEADGLGLRVGLDAADEIAVRLAAEVVERGVEKLDRFGVVHW
jgi:hypothetical protein